MTAMTFAAELYAQKQEAQQYRLTQETQLAAMTAQLASVLEKRAQGGAS